jgi:hypothetical protein
MPTWRRTLAGSNGIRREEARSQRAPWRRDQHRGSKGGSSIGYSGYEHQKGEQVIAITDHHGSVIAPCPVAPVHETDIVLVPHGLQALKQVAKKAGLDLRGVYLNLDGGFDSTHNRKMIFNKGFLRYLINKMILSPANNPWARHSAACSFAKRIKCTESYSPDVPRYSTL